MREDSPKRNYNKISPYALIKSHLFETVSYMLHSNCMYQYDPIICVHWNVKLNSYAQSRLSAVIKYEEL